MSEGVGEPSLRPAVARAREPGAASRWFAVAACLVLLAAVRTIAPVVLERLSVDQPVADDNKRRADLAEAQQRLCAALPRPAKLGYVCDEDALARGHTDIVIEYLKAQYAVAPHALTSFYGELSLLMVDLRFGADPRVLAQRLPPFREWTVLSRVDPDWLLLGSYRR